MRRFVALALAAVVVVAMAAALAGVVRLARDDDGRPGSGRGLGMMGAGGSMMGGRGRLDEAAYLTEMVAHHEEAVDAAQELARSDRPQLRAFGTAIVETQTAQVEQMRTWLAAWYPDEPPAQDYRPMMDDLAGLSGDQLDRTFLREMVVHHMAAVMMSQHLLQRGAEHDDVAELARAIRDGQHAEIIVMRRWLARWFDEGRAARDVRLYRGRAPCATVASRPRRRHGQQCGGTPTARGGGGGRPLATGPRRGGAGRG